MVEHSLGKGKVTGSNPVEGLDFGSCQSKFASVTEQRLQIYAGFRFERQVPWRYVPLDIQRSPVDK